MEECWQCLRNGMVLADEVCGRTISSSNKKRNEWWDDDVKDAIVKKKKAWQDY